MCTFHMPTNLLKFAVTRALAAAGLVNKALLPRDQVASLLPGWLVALVCWFGFGWFGCFGWWVGLAALVWLVGLLG